jgi:intracellular sulfur oxidation DsrE/DsrF family protein
MGVDTSPARIVAFMLEHGATVLIVREHLEDRGIPEDGLVPGVRIVDERESACLVGEHDSVLVW